MGKYGLHRIKDSFSARLRVYVVGFTALLFILAFYVFFRFSYGFIRDEAVNRAEALLDNTILRIDRVLDEVETAAANSAWEVETNLDEPDSLYNVVRRFVERNPIISGSAVAFRKDFYPEKGNIFRRTCMMALREQLSNGNWGMILIIIRKKNGFPIPCVRARLIGASLIWTPEAGR